MSAAPTHLYFDFFGTLVAYPESRVEQGFQASYEVLLKAGAETTYANFLDRWQLSSPDQFEQTFDHFGQLFVRHATQPTSDALRR